MINNYNDFCIELLKAGFSVASGGNDEGVFGLIRHSWNEQPPDSPIRWHTGDAEHDPWEWRIRVLNERTDIAYSKVFFRKAGYITKDWYPYFIAARRGNCSFQDVYSDGLYSQHAKRIYELLLENGSLPLHDIKLNGGFGKEDKSRFDKALTDLQMGLFITMCGQQQKRSNKGEEYGWASTMFCTVEEFWPDETIKKAVTINPVEAEKAITEQIFQLYPNANEKKIKKFIYGK